MIPHDLYEVVFMYKGEEWHTPFAIPHSRIDRDPEFILKDMLSKTLVSHHSFEFVTYRLLMRYRGE